MYKRNIRAFKSFHFICIDGTLLLCESANNLCVTTQRVHAGGQSLAKYGSLVCLTLQNAALSLLMRLSRTQHELFAATTAVVAAEVLKLAVCLALLFVEEQMGKGVNLGRLLVHTIVKQPMDTLRVMIPAIVYTIQNTLIYLGATHLDAATYQVTYQLKILTTALLSVAMLNKRLSRLQWLSLVLLFMGIALVQLTQISGPATAVAGHEQKPLIGFLAVFGACCLSGFAGVYFEKILKGSDVSLWMRNVQMALFSVPVGLVGGGAVRWAECPGTWFLLRLHPADMAGDCPPGSGRPHGSHGGQTRRQHPEGFCHLPGHCHCLRGVPALPGLPPHPRVHPGLHHGHWIHLPLQPALRPCACPQLPGQTVSSQMISLGSKVYLYSRTTSL
ncbi:SLC35A2 [Cordylochernes scorpioides]|uniref:SLC35A2 n=1 Tax=Cordylochernes scorpioides TaxID=51811 RepID=A0ABY6KLP8_9ARAC|nr:SLC35A2 [Cordylochernes scorpioides]